jgi:glycosyltransferase involved in cell wall biosynthesis
MNPEMSLVSVIVPVYNADKYLGEALESIVGQTYSPIEILVVDDGSTDNSVNVAKSFKSVEIISRKNNGAAVARNIGLKNCRGEFIAFLDADDYWVAHKTQRQMSYFYENPGVDCLAGRFRNFFETGASIPSGINKTDFLDDNLGKMPTLGTLLVRRNVFDRIGLFNPKLRIENDLDWLIRVRDAGIRLVSLDEILMFRRLHESNLSYRVNKTNFINIFRDSIKRKKMQGNKGKQ